MKKTVTKRLINFLKFLQGFIIPVLLCILWEYAARQNWIEVSITSSPSRIGNALWLWIQKGTLFQNIGISLRRALLGFICGSAMGILVGIFLGLSPRAYRYFRVLVGIMRPIPLIAWVPVFILLVGIGEDAKVLVISIGTFWPLFMNTFDGILNVDKKYLEVSRILKKSRWENITKVVLPASVPHIFTGLKLASGNALMGVIGAEMFAASSGLGYLVTYSKELAQPGKMFGAVFVIALLGWLLNLLVEAVEKNLSRK